MTDADISDPDLSRSREEKLKALAQRESVSQRTRTLAKRALQAIQEESS